MYFDGTHLLFPSFSLLASPPPTAGTHYGTLHFILLKPPSLWFAIATSCGLRQPCTFILPLEAETVQQALPPYKDGGCNPKPSFKLSTSGLGDGSVGNIPWVNQGVHTFHVNQSRGEVELGVCTPGDAVRVERNTPWLKLGDSPLM